MCGIKMSRKLSRNVHDIIGNWGSGCLPNNLIRKLHIGSTSLNRQGFIDAGKVATVKKMKSSMVFNQPYKTIA